MANTRNKSAIDNKWGLKFFNGHVAKICRKQVIIAFGSCWPSQQLCAPFFLLSPRTPSKQPSLISFFVAFRCLQWWLYRSCIGTLDTQLFLVYLFGCKSSTKTGQTGSWLSCCALEWFFGFDCRHRFRHSFCLVFVTVIALAYRRFCDYAGCWCSVCICCFCFHIRYCCFCCTRLLLQTIWV